MLTCPKCGLISLDGTANCDCGHKFEPRDVSHDSEPPGPSGVGGWLAFLTFVVFGLGPVFGAGRIQASFMAAEAENPVLSVVGHWGNLKAATWLAFLVFAAISVHAAWGLAKGRSWSVVQRALIALWITGPVAVIVLDGVVPLLTLRSTPGFEAAQLVDALVGGTARSFVVALLWSVYLAQSKRVRATYAKTAQPGSVERPA